MFNPTRSQARRFFADGWRKYRDGQPLDGLEAIAAELVAMHPEYHPLVESDDIDRDFPPESGQVNPWLHLGLHLAIAEQVSIDQPPGIRAEVDRLAAANGDRHAALHAALEALGEAMWRAQRDGTPPDQAAYLEAMRRRQK